MISKKTKYGLKAMTYLAKHVDEGPMGTSRIALDENISRKFLESILLTLKKNGFLSSKKGKLGGYYLQRDAKDMRMADILRVLEGPIAMLPCVSLNFYEKCDDCPDETTCAVHILMLKIRDSTLKILENNTLADFVR